MSVTPAEDLRSRAGRTGGGVRRCAGRHGTGGRPGIRGRSIADVARLAHAGHLLEGDLMHWWPWSKRERRNSGGDFSDAVVRLFEARAAGTVAMPVSTAAVEAAAGALSRASASAQVVKRAGMAFETPLQRPSWHFEGSHDPANLERPRHGIRAEHQHDLEPAGFGRGARPLGRHAGATLHRHRADFTSTRLMAETERSLADEAGGPLAQLLAVSRDGGDGSDDDPLAELKADIRAARGKALLVETTAAGWGEGRTAAPPGDWRSSRFGPMPPRFDGEGGVLARPGDVRGAAVALPGRGRRELA